ncbi:hypothetical protein OQA88_8242 [Cercophora sp. LCS_1]
MPSLETQVEIPQRAAAGGTSHADLVTLIITTSPTPSAPSTELIATILLSFKRHCPTLAACRVILVIDTFDRVTPEARLKKGCVTAEGAEKFAEYKVNVKQLLLDEFYDCFSGDLDDPVPELLSVSAAEAEYGADAYAQQTNAVPLVVTKTHDGRVTFIEPTQRIGFGLAVRSALRLTETPYVWIQQHDWALIADIPIGPLLDLMQKHRRPDDDEPTPRDVGHGVTLPIKYVCFPSIRMINYAKSDHVMQFPALRALTNLYKQNFSPPRTETLGLEEGRIGVKIPLTPLFFWHDKPHLAETEHYLSQVFPNRMTMPRGAFIEDTVGHRARTEMKDGQWKKWACWLFYPDEGKQLCVRHLKGRTWRGAEAEVAKRLEWMRLNRSLDS